MEGLSEGKELPVVSKQFIELSNDHVIPQESF
jgi:hypothetical protein